MLFSLYKNCMRAMGLWASYHAHQRAKRRKEDAQRLSERQGIASVERPQGPLAWIHAASVGETISTLPLLENLSKRYSDLTFLVTTGTLTAAAILEKHVLTRVIHQYVPYDIPQWINRFINHWQPDVVLWTESEFWPNLLKAIEQRRIPIVLINGRVSDKAFRRWSWAKSLIRPLLANFYAAFAWSTLDAQRLTALGIKHITDVGNVKFAAAPLNYDKVEYNALKKALRGRPVWVAASTHKGEEEIIAKAHNQLRQRLSNALCILIPRHPNRRDDIIAALNMRQGLAIRSKQDPVSAETTLYLADTLNELGLFYRLAQTAFVGGSFVPIGGHNVIEPLLLDCPCIHGPHMENIAEMTAFLDALGASISVNDDTELAEKLYALLTDPKLGQRMITKGKQAIQMENAILDRILETLYALLDPICKSHVAHP